MTPLRQLVLEELRCRIYAESTNAVQRHESRPAKLAAGYQRLKTASVKGDADSE